MAKESAGWADKQPGYVLPSTALRREIERLAGLQPRPRGWSEWGTDRQLAEAAGFGMAREHRPGSDAHKARRAFLLSVGRARRSGTPLPPVRRKAAAKGNLRLRHLAVAATIGRARKIGLRIVSVTADITVSSDTRYGRELREIPIAPELLREAGFNPPPWAKGVQDLFAAATSNNGAYPIGGAMTIEWTEQLRLKLGASR
jgi:hypothetical protein